MYDFNSLKMSDIVRLGIETRALGAKAETMEEASMNFVKYFFNNFVDQKTGEKSCVLIRFFKTHDADNLPKPLQEFANKLLQEKPKSESFKCLTLLG